MQASCVCLKPQTKPRDCCSPVVMVYASASHICCEINVNPSSHRGGYGQTVQLISVRPNTSKQILQPQNNMRVCLRLLQHHPVMHPGSGCAGIHSTQTRLTASCQEHDESCLDDHSGINKCPHLPADFSMPICLLTSAGIPAKSSRHSFLFRS